MREYRLSGPVTDECADRISRAIRSKVSGDLTVEIDTETGTVHVDASADPQVVSFAIEGEGVSVVSIDD